MDERERGNEAKDEEVKLPEERVEDLEPEREDEADVKGGAFKQGFPIKW